MGLCTEFGPQIHAGCDRPMVAGHDSCSCPTCHAVCVGRFPGCSGVWARGPQEVQLKSRQATPTTVSLRSSNGHRALEHSNGGASRAAPMAHAGGSGTANGLVDSPVLDQVLAAITALSRRMEQSSAPPPPETLEELRAIVKSLTDHMETLPDRIAGAIAGALGRQHRLIMDDFRSCLREFEAKLDGSSETAYLTGNRPPGL